MKRQTIKEIIKNIEIELTEIEKILSHIFENGGLKKEISFNNFMQLTAKKEGLLFTYHQLKGNNNLSQIYSHQNQGRNINDYATQETIQKILGGQ